MGARWLSPWPGGRVREVRGEKVWVIERRGRTITLTVTSERDALAELALFERDPGGYRPRRSDVSARVQIDEETLASFMLSLTRQGTTDEYRRYVRGYLIHWDRDLAGLCGSAYDFRALKLRDLTRIIDRYETAQHKRIVALKSFTSWLRVKGRLELHEDPTSSLAVPQAAPEITRRRKGYTMAQVRQVYRGIDLQQVRDIVRLRAAVGMHGSEIDRITRGAAVLREVNDPSGIRGTVRFPHKSTAKTGIQHAVSLDSPTYEAALRLADAGAPLYRAQVARCLERAARPLGIDFRPGELRHSFATWAPEHGKEVRPTDAGVPSALVSAVLGHTSLITARKRYIQTEVPPMIWLPLDLQHDDDPKGNK